MSAQAAEILERAAELLEARGWCQGEYEDAQGRYCSIGAIQTANMRLRSNSLALRHPVYTEAIGAFCRIIGHSDIVRWNDKIAETSDEVINAMRHAAKDLRNEAAPE